jgi:predicted membrane protein
MRLRWIVLWLVVVIVLFAIFVAEITETIRLTDVVSYFFLFVLALVIIAILAVIGAAFMGVLISHRIFSIKSFTPFEEEMLQMRKEVKDIKKTLEELSVKNKKD